MDETELGAPRSGYDYWGERGRIGGTVTSDEASVYKRWLETHAQRHREVLVGHTQECVVCGVGFAPLAPARAGEHTTACVRHPGSESWIRGTVVHSCCGAVSTSTTTGLLLTAGVHNAGCVSANHISAEMVRGRHDTPASGGSHALVSVGRIPALVLRSLEHAPAPGPASLSLCPRNTIYVDQAELDNARALEGDRHKFPYCEVSALVCVSRGALEHAATCL